MSTWDERIARTYQRMLQAEQEFFEKQEVERREREKRAIAHLEAWAATDAKIDPDILSQSQICRVDGQLTHVLVLSATHAVGFTQARSFLFEYKLMSEGSPAVMINLRTEREVKNMPELYGLFVTITEAIEYLVGLYRYQIDRSRLSSLM